jgi:hypothetical protein
MDWKRDDPIFEDVEGVGVELKKDIFTTLYDLF